MATGPDPAVDDSTEARAEGVVDATRVEPPEPYTYPAPRRPLNCDPSWSASPPWSR